MRQFYKLSSSGIYLLDIKRFKTLFFAFDFVKSSFWRFCPSQVTILRSVTLMTKWCWPWSSFYSGRMLPLRPPAGKPAPLVCTYAATGHNSAVLSLDVTEDLMFTGSKGWLAISISFLIWVRSSLSSGQCPEGSLSPRFGSVAFL